MSGGRVITLQIDGRDCGAREEQTILEVARENGIYIPTLCHLNGLHPVGGCRICLVEIAGAPRPLPACVTHPVEGMQVTTDNPELRRQRRLILELMLAEGNHICAVCVVNGHCELQELALQLGVDHLEVPALYPSREVDASHPRFGLDRNRCVLCTRCVRVCGEIEGAHTWDVMGRGLQAMVISDLNQPWGEAESCTGCGKCVQVCPTGALFEKGKSAGEMVKRHLHLPLLTAMRREEEAGE
ncbi:bidirectional hydrogenase complex protein HoxU [Desulfurivibrio dismutans]|uniref:bidirectional hydrogenase complex protein HoxU n=1 Tax=Desulfurivibrio dismutans TaxID=1398908 RepID=UPI0023D9A237|nr:bidirectional hydrogenase complex protein HoxU [Desulfurivibrio alkaliphilus]MDF1613494.1 bidirectional hydrogenase complex protein HoxU [Desulfurivibrio alkaliphilus]